MSIRAHHHPFAACISNTPLVELQTEDQNVGNCCHIVVNTVDASNIFRIGVKMPATGILSRSTPEIPRLFFRIGVNFTHLIATMIATFRRVPVIENQVISTTGVEPRGRPKGRATASPPCGVMNRDSTGDTPSVLCPRQAAGLPNNLTIPLSPKWQPLFVDSGCPSDRTKLKKLAKLLRLD